MDQMCEPRLGGEDVHPSSSRQLRDRLRRVESQLDQFLRVAGRNNGQTTAEDGSDRPLNHVILNPASVYKCPSNNASPASHRSINTPVEDEHLHDHLIIDRPPSSALLGGDPGASGADPLSQTLCDSLPSLQDTAKIYKASGGNHSIPFHEILTTPYGILDRDGLRSQSGLLEIPGLNVHLVLIARHMLRLASFADCRNNCAITTFSTSSTFPTCFATRLSANSITPESPASTPREGSYPASSCCAAGIK